MRTNKSRFTDFSDDELYLILSGINRIDDADPEDKNTLVSEIETELSYRNRS